MINYFFFFFLANLYVHASLCTHVRDVLGGSLCSLLVFKVLAKLPFRVCVFVAVGRGVSFSSLGLFIPDFLSAVAAGWRGAKGQQREIYP